MKRRSILLILLSLILTSCLHSAGYLEYVKHRDYVLSSEVYPEPVKAKLKSYPTSGRAGAWWRIGIHDPDALARRVRYVREHPEAAERTLLDVMEGLARIGMSKEEALASWGEPERINRDIHAWGTSEQWVYGSGSYLYFDDGHLSHIQTSR